MILCLNLQYSYLLGIATIKSIPKIPCSMKVKNYKLIKGNKNIRRLMKVKRVITKKVNGILITRVLRKKPRCPIKSLSINLNTLSHIKLTFKVKL